MPDAAIIQADYRHLEFKPGLKVARIHLEIPSEKASDFIKMFGTPDAVSPVKVAIARLVPDLESPGPDSAEQTSVNGAPASQTPATSDGGQGRRIKFRSQDAAYYLSQPEFCAWLMGRYQTQGSMGYGTPEAFLKAHLGIERKRDLDNHPEKGDAWDRLKVDFQYRGHRV